MSRASCWRTWISRICSFRRRIRATCRSRWLRRTSASSRLPGSVHGSLDINDNSVTQLALYLSGIECRRPEERVLNEGRGGGSYWSKDESIQVTPSTLSWNSATAYGLSGGATQLEFRTRGRTFELTKPARLPVFDGAIQVQRLDTRKVGLDDMELDFDATIEPISMRRLSKAFGWPELNGRLSGTIPGLSYPEQGTHGRR